MRTENHGFLLEDMINLYSIVTNDKYEYTVKSGLRIKEVAEFFGVTTNHARNLVCRPWKKSKYKPVLERKVEYDRKAYLKQYALTHDRTEYFREYRRIKRLEAKNKKEDKNGTRQNERIDNTMRLGKYLSGLTKPELDCLREQLNLTDDEKQVFEGLARGRSITRVADDCVISPATVSYRSKKIKEKMNRLKVGEPDDRADD